MTAAIPNLERKITPLLGKGKKSLQDIVKEALFLKLRDINGKIAAFEGKYNQGFSEFRRQWGREKTAKNFLMKWKVIIWTGKRWNRLSGTL